MMMRGMNKTKTDDAADAVIKALHRAYILGQTYWQQADSESYRQNKKADETKQCFATLVEETRALVLAKDSVRGPLSDVLELLPCPFCDSDDIHYAIDKADDKYEFVMCNGCGVYISRADSRPERRPIEVWNMRSNAGYAPSDA
jgi:hypothetical protein